MEKVVQKFNSFEESEKAEKEYYLNLTPRERMQILFELNSRWPQQDDADSIPGCKRVYRIIKLQ